MLSNCSVILSIFISMMVKKSKAEINTTGTVWTGQQSEQYSLTFVSQATCKLVCGALDRVMADILDQFAYLQGRPRTPPPYMPLESPKPAVSKYAICVIEFLWNQIVHQLEISTKNKIFQLDDLVKSTRRTCLIGSLLLSKYTLFLLHSRPCIPLYTYVLRKGPLS